MTNLDEALAKIDSLCNRIEDTLLELQRIGHPNAGKSWSGADDEELRRLFGSGNAVEDLALLFGRTPNGIRQRLERLGILPSAPAA